MKEFNETNYIKQKEIISLSLNEEENPYHQIKNKKKKKKEFPSSFLVFFSALILIFLLISIIIYYINKHKIKESIILNANFKTSLLDNNKYELIKLNNGIEVLLIQDKKTEKSSLSLVLQYGYLTDLNNPGIAHLIMHFLYLKIQKNTDNDLRDYFGKSSSKITRFYTSFNFYCLNDGLYKIIKNFGLVFSQKIEEKILDFSEKIDNFYQLKNKNDENTEEHLINYLVEGVNNSKNEEILPEGNKYTSSNIEKIKELINNYYYGENIKIVLYSQLKMSLAKTYIIEAFNNIKSNNNSNITNYYNEEKNLIQIKL